MASDPHTRFDIAVRTTGDTSSVMNSVRREIRSLEPGLLIDKTETMAHRIDESVAPRRLNLLLFDLFAGLALLLAAVGLYGVVAYTAGQRSQEFGIRMALGAQGHDVLQLVMSQGLKLALTGTTLGVVAALYVARLMKRLLFGVEPTDPTTLLGVSLLLMGVALAACWLPARRATRIAPIEALRME
jgi:ABC-type antimicrobial peptide transport system permease subunit